MREFFEDIRWTAVGWIVVWVAAFAVAAFLPELREMLAVLIGFGIAVTLLLLGERE